MGRNRSDRLGRDIDWGGTGYTTPQRTVYTENRWHPSLRCEELGSFRPSQVESTFGLGSWSLLRETACLGQNLIEEGDPRENLN